MTDAQQPGLRSYIVYDEPPAGCIVFENRRRSVGPHVHTGEFAVVDPTDRDPIHGELFLIEWESTGNRQLVEMMERDRDGSEHRWYAVTTQRMMNLAGFPSGPTRWGDGPYREPDMRKKLVGRVVGIYQPDFRQALEGRAA